jgi:hypothetical protein
MDSEGSPAQVTAGPEPSAGLWSAPGKPLLLALLALLLIAAAAGLRRIERTNADIESLPQLLRDARTLYLPALHGGSSWTEALLHDHAPGLRAWKLGWLALNGQIDSRALQVVALGLQVAATGLLFLVLVSALKRRWAATLGVAIAAVVAAPAAAGLAPATDSAWGSLLVLLSLLHLTLMLRHDAGSWRWWLGLICGGLNIVAATEGIASALALVVFAAIGKMGPRPAPERRSLLPANTLLVIAGVALGLTRMPGWQALFFAPAAFTAWPFASEAWAVLLWAPAVVCIVSAIRGRTNAAQALPELPALALWAFLQAAVTGAAQPTAAATLLIGSVMVNAACFALLPARDAFSRTRNLILLSAWTIAVGNALLHPAHPPQTAGIEADAPVIVALRRALRSGNTGALREAPGLTADERSAALALVATAGIREFLPASIRRPLHLEPALNAASQGFRAEAVPELPDRGGLPAFGTWPGGDGAAPEAVQFVSAPLATAFPWVQFRVAGTPNFPAASLRLVTNSGAEVAPLGETAVAPDKWRRVNFAAPGEPFRLAVRGASPPAWFAFTAPVEIGGWSRLAGKLPRLWPWLLASGLLLAGGLAIGAWVRVARDGRAAREGPGEPRLNWRVLPWLALGGYAVFFSNHLDPVAGPNDSGGYLNSAKALVEGHLTAAPRTLAGPAGGETDITPYLPTTFRAHPSGRMAPEYPVGFPLEIWAVAQFMPLQRAVPAVLLLQLVLGIVFTRLLAGAFGLPRGWAWLAGGLIGLSPVYLFQALQPQSDGPALVWVTAAVYWAWSSRTKPWHAVLAGFATALAVLIRPANVLCLLPVLFCLAGKWRRTFWWALAGLPGAVFLAWYNRELFGHWLATGYGDPSASFGLRFIPPTLGSYARWLPEFFTPVIVLGLAAPFLRSIPAAARLVLAGWVAVFLAFYALWWCTWDTWFNMRFVLPAAPAMVVLALLVLRALCEKLGWRLFTAGPAAKTLWPTAVAVLALFGFQVARTTARQVLFWMHANHEHADGALWVRDRLPANAVIFAQLASNPLWHYTDQVFIRADHPAVRREPSFLARIRRAGRPIYALTYHWEARNFDLAGERQGADPPDLPGTWQRVAVLRADRIYLWQQTSPDPPAPAKAANESRAPAR